jgi:hypothetical protein
MRALEVLIVVLGLIGIMIGILEVSAPEWAIRIRARMTPRGGSLRNQIDRLVGLHPEEGEPSPRARRNVRLIGIVMIVSSAAATYGAISIIRRALEGGF